MEGCWRIDEFGRVRFGADGVIAFKVTCNEIMAVNEFASGYGLCGETNDLVEFTDGLPGRDGVYREFVPRGDVGTRGQMQAVEGLAGSDRLEGDHNVVRASEFESVVAQTVLLSLARGYASYFDAKHWYDHTLLHSTIKGQCLPLPAIFRVKSSIVWR